MDWGSKSVFCNHLLGELQKEKVGDLLDIIAVTDPRVLEDVGVVPDFGNNG